MGLATWLASAAMLVVAILALALFDQARARKASESLRSTAESMGAMPIASMRNGAQIVFSRRDASSSETPFTMVHAGESRPLSAAEIQSLWNRGRLWWYHTGETPPLGLSYYLRYVDGQYFSACKCAFETDSDAGAKHAEGERGEDRDPR